VSETVHDYAKLVNKFQTAAIKKYAAQRKKGSMEKVLKSA